MAEVLLEVVVSHTHVYVFAEITELDGLRLNTKLLALEHVNLNGFRLRNDRVQIPNKVTVLHQVVELVVQLVLLVSILPIEDINI